MGHIYSPRCKIKLKSKDSQLTYPNEIDFTNLFVTVWLIFLSFLQITKWGDVGDRTVMLDLEDGRVILNILASKTTPDGDITRIISRVKYSENVPRTPFPVSKN